jgi:hypothetical protein
MAGEVGVQKGGWNCWGWVSVAKLRCCAPKVNTTRLNFVIAHFYIKY